MGWLEKKHELLFWICWWRRTNYKGCVFNYWATLLIKKIIVMYSIRKLFYSNAPSLVNLNLFVNWFLQGETNEEWRALLTLAIKTKDFTVEIHPGSLGKCEQQKVKPCCSVEETKKSECKIPLKPDCSTTPGCWWGF